jgi:DNA-binding NtrC family response regulator
MPAGVILVVDDEPVVLSAVVGVLRHYGYVALAAGSASDALHVGRLRTQPIDLMVCDVLMPRLSGPRLAEEFSDLHSETQYLFMAGLPNHPDVIEQVIERGQEFLAKPFLPKELLDVVNKLMERRPKRARTAGR